MKATTKIAAVLWIGMGFYFLLWHVTSFHRLTDIIMLLAVAGIICVLPAAALLLGHAFGWWMMMVLSALDILALIFVFHGGAMVAGIAVYCGLVLGLLLLDRPSRWEIARPRPG